MATPRDYRDKFSGRVKRARESAGYTQDQMAQLLHMSQTTYSKYEGARATLLPHHLIAQFCLITRISQEWLLSGTGRGPFVPRKRTLPEDDAEKVH
jgi:transcriptional regulator with XRE-family HTH domain